MRFLLMAVAFVALSTTSYASGFGDFLKQASDTVNTLTKPVDKEDKVENETKPSEASSDSTPTKPQSTNNNMAREIKDAKKELAFADLLWSDSLNVVAKKLKENYEDVDVKITDKNRRSKGSIVFEFSNFQVQGLDCNFFKKYLGVLQVDNGNMGCGFNMDEVKAQQYFFVREDNYEEYALADQVKFQNQASMLNMGTASFTKPFGKLYTVQVFFTMDDAQEIYDTLTEKYGSHAVINDVMDDLYGTFWFDNETETGLLWQIKDVPLRGAGTLIYYNFRAMLDVKESYEKYFKSIEEKNKALEQKGKGLL